MGLVALADFGSTYTKVNLVDRDEGRLLARAEAPTSIGTDLMEGYAAALAAASDQVSGPVALEAEIAASSAGGGLRIAAIGLVADLTAAAAHQAALNAGARVEAVLSGRLGTAELERLQRARAEIVLFAGGTDGGQGRLVLENARRLAEDGVDAYVVVACNADVAAEAVEILVAAGIEAEAAANVMPALGRLEIDGAREAISRVFLEHVIGGKGLSAEPRVRADGEDADAGGGAARGRLALPAATKGVGVRVTRSWSTSAAPPPTSTPTARSEPASPGVEAAAAAGAADPAHGRGRSRPAGRGARCGRRRRPLAA